MREKQKLTLSVEKELIEKAKKLGVNISEITETVLRHISQTETKEVVTYEEVKDAYKKLFDAMLPAMRKFDAPVKVGKLIGETRDEKGRRDFIEVSVSLLGNGEFWIEELEDITDFEKVNFDPPKEILSNYIDSLIRSSDYNKEKLKELEIFRRIIEALTETTVPEYRNHKEKKLET